MGGSDPAILATADRVPASLVPTPVVVVDRWGSALNATARYTARMLNAALVNAGAPPIEIYAVGAGAVERVDLGAEQVPRSTGGCT